MSKVHLSTAMKRSFYGEELTKVKDDLYLQEQLIEHFEEIMETERLINIWLDLADEQEKRGNTHLAWNMRAKANREQARIRGRSWMLSP